MTALLYYKNITGNARTVWLLTCANRWQNICPLTVHTAGRMTVQWKHYGASNNTIKMYYCWERGQTTPGTWQRDNTCRPDEWKQTDTKTWKPSKLFLVFSARWRTHQRPLKWLLRPSDRHAAQTRKTNVSIFTKWPPLQRMKTKCDIHLEAIAQTVWSFQWGLYKFLQFILQA